MTQDNEALNSTSLHVALDELQGQFRDIDQGLDRLDPAQLTRNDLNNIRYYKLRQAAGTAQGLYSGPSKLEKSPSGKRIL